VVAGGVVLLQKFLWPGGLRMVAAALDLGERRGTRVGEEDLAQLL
jgi:hypothetical protein